MKIEQIELYNGNEIINIGFIIKNKKLSNVTSFTYSSYFFTRITIKCGRGYQ